MKKIDLKILILIFTSFTFKSLTASDIGRVPAPFTIPVIGKQPDYSRAKLPLCSGCEHATREIILSIMFDKLSAYMQCPYISQYDSREQIRIITMANLAHKKIVDLTHESYSANQNLNSFNHRNEMPLTHVMLHQCMLIKRLHELQEYKETAHENFIQKQNK